MTLRFFLFFFFSSPFTVILFQTRNIARLREFLFETESAISKLGRIYLAHNNMNNKIR